MTVTVVAVGIIFLGIMALAYRMVALKQPNASMTSLVASLAGALMLRSPTIGDRVIDGALGGECGLYNLPDLAGHTLTFVAMASAITYVSCATQGVKLRIVYGTLAVLWALSVAVFVLSHVWKSPTENIVKEPGMALYAALFSLALLVTHVVVLWVVVPTVRNFSGTDLWQFSLIIGAGSGAAMAIHRLGCLVVPPLKDFAYQPVTWTLSLLCIGGYIIACFLINRQLARQDQ